MLPSHDDDGDGDGLRERSWRGTLVRDEYKAYESVMSAEPGRTAAGCLAHARRKFDELLLDSGKSAVAAILAARGAVIVDADAIAREVVEPGTPGLAGVVSAFRIQVLAADGTLDRAKLAQIVFTDEAARAPMGDAIVADVALTLKALLAEGPESGRAAPEARPAPGTVTVPLRLQLNASPFWIMLLLVSGKSEHGMIRIWRPDIEFRRSRSGQSSGIVSPAVNC